MAATSGNDCGGDQVDAVGNPQNLSRRHGHLFGVAAAGQQGDDLVPHGERLGHAGPEPGDPARDFQPGNLRGPGRGRVVALALLDVGAVEPRGDDVDQHLAGAGHRRRDLADLQGLGSAGL